MYIPNEQSQLAKINEMMEQIDKVFSELRLEYYDMVKWYDEALQRIEELESDMIFREEMEDGLV